MHPKSHYTTVSAALSALFALRLDGHGADLLKRQLEELPSEGRAFHVLVHPHLLGNSIALLGVYHSVRIVFGPQISLQAYNG